MLKSKGIYNIIWSGGRDCRWAWINSDICGSFRAVLCGIVRWPVKPTLIRDFPASHIWLPNDMFLLPWTSNHQQKHATKMAYFFDFSAKSSYPLEFSHSNSPSSKTVIFMAMAPPSQRTSWATNPDAQLISRSPKGANQQSGTGTPESSSPGTWNPVDKNRQNMTKFSQWFLFDIESL